MGSTRVSRVGFGRRAETFCERRLPLFHPINVNRYACRSNSAGRRIEPAGAGATHSIRKFLSSFLISPHLHGNPFIVALSHHEIERAENRGDIAHHVARQQARQNAQVQQTRVSESSSGTACRRRGC